MPPPRKFVDVRYHMKCLKISKKKFDHNEGWDCPICDWRKGISRATTRPTLSDLKEWVGFAETLPFRPDELQVTAKNIDLIEAWVASILPVLENPQSLTINKCRFYLRKIEGGEIFLPAEYNLFRRTAHSLAPTSSTPPPLAAETKVSKKLRTKKPKLEIVASAQERDSHRFGPRFDPEPRLLPAQRFPPMQTDLSQPRPYANSQPYPSYHPNAGPPMHSLPLKGIFMPPQQQILPLPFRGEEQRPPPVQERLQPICGSCNNHFILGTHNKPLSCVQCSRLHHTICISKYGGRLYPEFIWYFG